ncbi:TM2 domain-containing protein [Ditylenchus destructor]|uniref:TM2 domain-containing protein n=1 Tax=Ditylenchus destructor TaxID=166010 RepID=A0AAD4R6S8_9BILA|nr:TM2 domain-containing protein [Ditylenchus destructor]
MSKFSPANYQQPPIHFRNLSSIKRILLLTLIIISTTIPSIADFSHLERSPTNNRHDPENELSITISDSASANSLPSTEDGSKRVQLKQKIKKKLPPGSLAPSLPVEDTSMCSRVDCSNHGSCLSCSFPSDCQYGLLVMLNCTTHPKCPQRQTLRKEAVCRFCWQTPDHEHDCDELRNCSTQDFRLVRTQCKVADHVLCMGRRVFYKNIRCEWTNGYSWSKAMLLSVTLGGFGVDRFYLGLWKSAIGKLFSFGGLGIWTLVDIVLIGVGYIQPADGSMYI